MKTIKRISNPQQLLPAKKYRFHTFMETFPAAWSSFSSRSSSSLKSAESCKWKITSLHKIDHFLWKFDINTFQKLSLSYFVLLSSKILYRFQLFELNKVSSSASINCRIEMNCFHFYDFMQFVTLMYKNTKNSTNNCVWQSNFSNEIYYVKYFVIVHQYGVLQTLFFLVFFIYFLHYTLHS